MIMSRLEYLLYSIKNEYLKDITWYFTFMTILTEKNYKNKYVEIKSGVIYVLIDGKQVMLNGVIKNEPIYAVTDNLTLPKNTINNIDNVKTTFGLVILNYVLLYVPIGKRVTYENKPFNIGKIEARVGELLNTDVITVEEFKKFDNNALFLEKLSRIVTISATYKNITPPDGLKEFKTKTIKEFNTKYGENWYKDATKVVEFEDKLKAFYNDYVSDDPSDGVFLSGKIKNNAGLKKYLTFGLAFGMEEAGEETQYIEGSLLDGPPKDKKKLAGMFDTARSASYNRGAETQKGGYAAKVMLRAISSVKIIGKDCGTKLGKDLLVNENIKASLVGRYLVTPKGPKVIKDIDEASKYVGKTITIRSPQFCKSKGTSFCPICSGDNISKYGNFVISITDISNILLYQKMKMMHNTAIQGMSTNPIEQIR